MCVKECKLSNTEAAQLIKEYTSDTERGVIEFIWTLALCGSIKSSQRTSKCHLNLANISSLVSNFYICIQPKKDIGAVY